jgi:hypothetical protein
MPQRPSWNDEERTRKKLEAENQRLRDVIEYLDQVGMTKSEFVVFLQSTVKTTRLEDGRVLLNDFSVPAVPPQSVLDYFKELSDVRR